MKTKAMTILLAAATLAGMTACTNDDNNVAVDNNAPVAARITAGLAGDAVATPAGKAGQPGTRAVDDRWNGDDIGVAVLKSPGSDMATRYRNAHYATTSTGTTAEFAPNDAANTIYFADPNETVEFIAYAPYQPSASPGELPGTDGVITIDATKQATVEEQEAIDFIVSGIVPASKASPTVAFSFWHAMSRLVLHIQTPAANGFLPDDVKRISSISLGGLCTGGTFDVKMQDPAAGLGFTYGADPDTWTDNWDIAGYVHTVGPDKNNVTQRTHTLIFSHQRIKDVSGNLLNAVPIAITLDGKVYKNDKDITGTADDGGNTGFFRTGTSYEYTIRLKKSTLEVTHATIQNWTNGGIGGGDATKQ